MNKEGEVRIPSGCAIAGVITRAEERISGKKIVENPQEGKTRVKNG